jgi:ABC-type multidrug transport system fused ATPase/permease subunit
MIYLAATNWWEPNTAGIIDIGDITAFIVLLTAISGILLGISRWWMKLLRNIIRDELAIATEPINPKSNGGLSLADVARRTTSLEEKVTEIHDQNVETHKLLTEFMLKVLDASPKTSTPRKRAPKKSS